MSFERAIEFVFPSEGGFVNDPDDHGGATNFGITQGTFNKWRQKSGKLTALVSTITRHEATQIYKAWYWQEAHCDFMPEAIAIAVFDAAVNCGVSRATKFLQTVLRVQIDGAYGKRTKDALDKATLADGVLQPRKVREIAEDVIDQRRQFHRAIVTNDDTGKQQKFLRGWLARCDRLEKLVASLDPAPSPTVQEPIAT